MPSTATHEVMAYLVLHTGEWVGPFMHTVRWPLSEINIVWNVTMSCQIEGVVLIVDSGQVFVSRVNHPSYAANGDTYSLEVQVHW